MKNSVTFPRITIITPSFNQGRLIEKAIKSVVDQKYPNYEHIVIDGKSSDDTLDILKKNKQIKWISEPDKGCVDAVNKGLKMSTGDIISILNTDDYYEPKAFYEAIKILNRTSGVFFVVGNCNVVNRRCKFIRINKPRVKESEIIQFWRYQFPVNPSAYFYYKDIHKNVGLYDTKFDRIKGSPYDYDFLIRLSKRYELYYIDKTLGNYRFYEGTKTFDNKEGNFNNCLSISRTYWGSALALNYYRYSFSYFTFWVRERLDLVVDKFRVRVALRTRLRNLFLSSQ